MVVRVSSGARRALLLAAVGGVLGFGTGFGWGIHNVQRAEPPEPCPTPVPHTPRPPQRVQPSPAPPTDGALAGRLASLGRTGTLQQEMLGHTGAVQCVQERTCGRFENTLVVIHLNPIRVDLWIDQLLELHGLFVPNIVFYSVLEPGKEGGLDAGDVLYVGKRRTRVYLMDDRMGQSDYMNVVSAWKRWPGFDSYMLLHDDMLVNWWELADSTRLPPSRVWIQEPDPKLSYDLSHPASPDRGPAGGYGARQQQIRDALRHFRAEDVKKLRGKGVVVKVSGVWHVPKAAMSQVAQYGAVMWKAGAYIEN
eukprot:Hpha_TRINITY_DN27517_c0_g1::TRINITY_DN27517_c0_g1_i1::g.86274::m.86274